MFAENVSTRGEPVEVAVQDTLQEKATASDGVTVVLLTAMNVVLTIARLMSLLMWI